VAPYMHSVLACSRAQPSQVSPVGGESVPRTQCRQQHSTHPSGVEAGAPVAVGVTVVDKVVGVGAVIPAPTCTGVLESEPVVGQLAVRCKSTVQHHGDQIGSQKCSKGMQQGMHFISASALRWQARCTPVKYASTVTCAERQAARVRSCNEAVAGHVGMLAAKLLQCGPHARRLQAHLLPERVPGHQPAAGIGAVGDRGGVRLEGVKILHHIWQRHPSAAWGACNLSHRAQRIGYVAAEA
jgi:hypothetical protein